MPKKKIFVCKYPKLALMKKQYALNKSKYVQDGMIIRTKVKANVCSTWMSA